MFDGAQLLASLDDGWKLYRLPAGEGWLYFAWGTSGPAGLGWVPHTAQERVNREAGAVHLEVTGAPGPTPQPWGVYGGAYGGAYGRGPAPLVEETVNLADALQALAELAARKDG